jgi:hypothetical protein
LRPNGTNTVVRDQRGETQIPDAEVRHVFLGRYAGDPDRDDAIYVRRGETGVRDGRERRLELQLLGCSRRPPGVGRLADADDRRGPFSDMSWALS